MKENDASMIGDIGWKNTIGISMRYVNHNFFASMDNDNLVAPPPPSPYANILVESPELPKAVIIQVSHKIDFYNLWILAEKRILDDKDLELIIKHKPPSGVKKLVSAFLPHLEYLVFHRGYLEAIHNPEERDFVIHQEPYIYLYDQTRQVNMNND